MKRIIPSLLWAVFLVFCIVSCEEKNNNYGGGQTVVPTPEDTTSVHLTDTVVALAYVTSWSSIVPDPAVLTHINYAFAHVNDTYNGIKIDNEERLKAIIALKEQNKSLKVLLSVGGWGSGRFSEMAANPSHRASFAKDCKRVVDAFNLDGIDIDWEFPTSNAAGISSSPHDIGNYNLLMQELRHAIGKNKLLTFAADTSTKYYDFKALADVVDFVNLMMYNVDNPPYHHAALFRSDLVGNTSAEESIKAIVAAGFPIGKLVLGLPFYGRATAELSGSGTLNYSQIAQQTAYTQAWDDVAKAPYLVNASGQMVCSYDNPQSIKAKCDYAKEQGLLGIMYWEYAGDDPQGTLRHAVWDGLMKD